MGEFNVRGGELRKLLKLARAQPVSFAYGPGKSPKEDYFGLDKQKPPKTILKKAQDEGPSKKVAFGTIQVDGKLLCVTCERELPSLAKKLKKFLALEKITLNVKILGADGTLLEEDIAENPEEMDAPEPPIIASDTSEPAQAGQVSPSATEEQVEETKSPLMRLADEHAALVPMIERALTQEGNIAKQIERLNEKIVSSFEQGKEGVAIQFMDMLKGALAKLPPDAPEQGSVQKDDAAKTPETVAEDAGDTDTPLGALSASYRDMEPLIARALSGEPALAKQVQRLSEKVQTSLEAGKEGMAIQFMDMLGAELAKLPDEEPEETKQVAQPGADDIGADDAPLPSEQDADDELARALADPATDVEDTGEESEDLEDPIETGDLVDPAAYAVYFRKAVTRMKKRQMQFGVAMASNDPADLRFVFHPKKRARRWHCLL